MDQRQHYAGSGNAQLEGDPLVLPVILILASFIPALQYTPAGRPPAPVGGGGPAPVILQHSETTVDGVFTTTLPSHAAGGLTCISGSFTAGATTTPANTAAFTWTLFGSNTVANAGFDQKMWCASTSAFGSTDTIAVTTTATNGGIEVADVSVVTSLDATAGASNTGGFTTITTGNFAVTGTNDMVLEVSRGLGGGDLTSTGYTSLTAGCGGCTFWYDPYNLVAYRTFTTSPVIASAGAGTSWDILAVALK